MLLLWRTSHPDGRPVSGFYGAGNDVSGYAALTGGGKALEIEDGSYQSLGTSRQKGRGRLEDIVVIWEPATYLAHLCGGYRCYGD